MIKHRSSSTLDNIYSIYIYTVYSKKGADLALNRRKFVTSCFLGATITACLSGCVSRCVRECVCVFVNKWWRNESAWLLARDCATNAFRYGWENSWQKSEGRAEDEKKNHSTSEGNIFITHLSRPSWLVLHPPTNSGAKHTTRGMATTTTIGGKTGKKRDPELLASECKCGSKWVQMRVRMMMLNAKDGQKFIDLNCRHLSLRKKD